jgi:hypothetical protein
MFILVLITYIRYKPILSDCPSWGARLDKSTGHDWLPGSWLGLSHAITSTRLVLAGNWITDDALLIYLGFDPTQALPF